MVIDTSAIVAIFFGEPDAPRYRERIADDPVRLVSAATLVEAAMVIEGRFGEAGGAELDLWLHKTDAEIVAVTAEHADQARRAPAPPPWRVERSEPRLRLEPIDRGPWPGSRLLAAVLIGIGVIILIIWLGRDRPSAPRYASASRPDWIR